MIMTDRHDIVKLDGIFETARAKFAENSNAYNLFGIFPKLCTLFVSECGAVTANFHVADAWTEYMDVYRVEALVCDCEKIVTPCWDDDEHADISAKVLAKIAESKN